MTATPKDAARKKRRASARGDGMTPMFAQYFEIKQAHPDSLLFFRMGDFYELFFDDAVKAAAALDIALTKRGQHDGAPVPMCGVPAHSHEGYLQRLIRQGFKVAICDQTEDPAAARKRPGKTLVERAVVRVVTPGTLTEDALLDARAHNHLAALARAQDRLALAWVDISTGLFTVAETAPDRLAILLAQIAPGEILVPDLIAGEPAIDGALAEWRAALTLLPASRFDSLAGERRLKQGFDVAALDGFGMFSRAELAAAGAALDYVAQTQKGRMPRIAPPRRQVAAEVMAIDVATRRNLELSESLSGHRQGTLLAVIDRTLTGAGGRLLAARLSAPLTDPAAINRRLDDVQAFADRPEARQRVRAVLRGMPDLERALGRLSLDRGGPRDLAAIRDGLDRAEQLGAALRQTADQPGDAALAPLAADLGGQDILIDRLRRALSDELPLLARDGGFIAPGYAPEFDAIRDARDDSRRQISGLEAEYRGRTGIASVKVRHNNVLGYYVEVPPSQADKLTGDDAFIHRQTLAGAVRFTTVTLGELEHQTTRAADRALAVELELFADLVGEVTARSDAIAATAAVLARIDAAAALADLAVERDYARPEVDTGTAFVVDGGRHPVVEALQAGTGSPFIANDCDLAEAQRLWLLTGPNMAGKSTFLRQNALIAVLAQMGSYVPARAAHIGVVEQLFSRVGAADDLARGRSTFMVEMVETAAILNQAGPRALVILDEIGRGTATYDGLSIAWATVEHLHDVNRCRALFATHYHELTALAARLDGLSCRSMRVREWDDKIVFLYEVAAGAADRSYGIHVARLAGLPPAVVSRAEQVLATLEQDERGSATVRLADDLPLFAAAPPAAPEAAGPRVPAVLAEALDGADPDQLTPRDALDLLYRLKSLWDEED